MHVTVQKPTGELLEELRGQERVFVLGCAGCAARQHFGGAAECAELAEQLGEAQVTVTGWSAPQPGENVCTIAAARALAARHRQELEAADTVVLLACPQGLETVRQAVGQVRIVQGTRLVTGGLTGGGWAQVSSCHFCAECIADLTAGLCPHAYCAKGLLNGPCGGAQAGRCEVSRGRPCVWELIFRRLQGQGRLELLMQYNHPADFGMPGADAGAGA